MLKSKTPIIASIVLALATFANGEVLARNHVEDQSFRYRIQTVDSLFQRAKSARREQSVTYSAYRALVEILRQEEITISEQASSYQFQDVTESNYWRRGRLKFPSSLKMELVLLEEGKDPAVQ